MSASASESKSQTSTESVQASTQGASGAGSPTITAGSAVNFSQNDPKLQLDTVKTLGDVIKAVLASAGNAVTGALGTVTTTQAAVAQSNASQGDQNQALLAQVIAADQQVAAAKGTGGASLTSATTNYLIFGALGLIGLVFLMGRRRE